MKISDALLRKKELGEKLFFLEKEHTKMVGSFKLTISINELGSRRRTSEHLHYFYAFHYICNAISQHNLNPDSGFLDDINEDPLCDFSPELSMSS